MVNLVRHDLEFILRQIKIAEAHAAGVDTLANLIAQEGAPAGGLGTNPAAASLLPYGLRTVDGSYNNIVPGRENWGAADQPFKQLLTPTYLNETDNDSITFGGGPALIQGNYGANGSVVDADPRIISNLIVDQSVDNPAARSLISGDNFAFDHDGNEATPDLVPIPNVAPDEGLSSPFNGWMTLFGQFFDHGLDLVTKGGNGTVYVPLQSDDPLYVAGSPTNFMALTRVSPEPLNLTTAWVDQNQTYSSTASKQIFMREYIKGPVGTPDAGKPIATGHLLEGVKGGLATWGDVKKQAAEVLGIRLTDADVGSVPLIVSDAYGNFIPGSNGYPQVVIGLGGDGELGTADDVLLQGNPAAPVSLPATTVRTGHAFLDDIAHNAVPSSRSGPLAADTDTVAGNAIPVDGQGNNLAYDNELLDAHYVTGDGRGNENIGLTAVHHVFHSEHNRLVDETKKLAFESGDLAFLNEWLLVDVQTIPTTPAGLVWDGERLFQAARFTNEMEYQHLVFEEFGRKMQPDVDAFVFNASVDIDPSITAEFAHVVYRFGHSMLTEDIDIIKMVSGKPVSADISLIQGFLNPVTFDNGGMADQAAGAIIRGMTRQVGSEIDEFVTPALRSNLLGLPLDLATINLTRGRDVGMPSFNKARETFYEATNDTQLKPYESWVDLAENLKNPASIINFVAAYGTHETITAETTTLGKRAAATALVLGQEQSIADDLATDADESRTFAVPEDRVAFLNATGSTYAGGALGGLNNVDFWIGGLAEKQMAFGGMLGSTFSFVFEQTMEKLQDGDRFYYLSRTQGLNLLNELENNSLSSLIMRNTDLGDPGSTSLPGDSFSAVSIILEMDLDKQTKPDPAHSNTTLQALNPMVTRKDIDGDGDPDYIKIVTNEHVVIGGTNEGDTIISGGGDDALWGRAGDDYIEAGYGVDKVHGDDGDDIIVNAGTDIGETDFFHGGEGNDVISGGSGLALLFGNEGQDFLIAGPDGKEVFGGTGNDFILGGEGADFLLGNEGDDWLEAGNGFDGTAGDNSELFFNSSILGHDVMFSGQNEHDFDAESGDDIMVQGESVMRNEGMFGYDWSIHKGNQEAADSDLGRPIFTTDQADILRDRFDQVEALSGWDKNDSLKGDSRTNVPNPNAESGAGLAETALINNELSHAGLDRITGLRSVLGDLVSAAGPDVDLEATTAFDDGNILLGGSGSDTIEGRGGNDVIDGDRWLNVRIQIDTNGQIYSADGMTAKVYLDSDIIQGVISSNAVAQFGGKTLSTLMLDRTLNPGQLSIVREVVKDDGVGDADVAVYWDVRANYTATTNVDGSVTLSHTGFNPANRPVGTNFVSDGEDRLSNVERVRFSDGEVAIQQLFISAPTDIQWNGVTPGDGMQLTGNLANGLPAAGTVVASLSTTDVDTSSGFVYSLAAGSSPGFAVSATGTVTRTGSAMAPNTAFTLNITSSDTTGAMRTEAFNIRTGTNSVLFGNNGANNLTAGAADDVQYGSGGNDTHNGSTGNDNLFGQAGNDILNGNAGNDILVGGGGSDTVIGGAGNDIIRHTVGDGNGSVDGGADTDTMLVTAGTGNQTLNVTFNGTTLTNVDGSSVANVEIVTADLATGTDTLGYTAAGGVTVNLLTGAASGFASIAGIENVRGNGGADSLTGNVGTNVLEGGAGSDSLNGGAGGDVLIGGAGIDQLDTGAPDDNLQDIIRFSALGDFGDAIVNFDANGLDGADDRVEFGGALNAAWDDGSSDDNFTFAVGNGAAGTVGATVGQNNGNIEALMLTGTGIEGVTTASLANATAVSAAFNAEFVIAAANGEDALLVINDTDGNDFSLWQWTQAGGGEITASELLLIGIFDANSTVTVGNFDFI